MKTTIRRVAKFIFTIVATGVIFIFFLLILPWAVVTAMRITRKVKEVPVETYG
jgi:hypothetical protein